VHWCDALICVTTRAGVAALDVLAARLQARVGLNIHLPL
jgi:hypothetical protein